MPGLLELHLCDPRDLFVFNADAYDPFDPASLGESGVDYLKGRVGGRRVLPQPVHTTLYLPPDKLDQDTPEAIRASLRRYCEAQIEQVQQERDTFLADQLVFLLIAVVIALLALALESRLASLPIPGGHEVEGAISLGLDVLTWVVLWTPLSAFALDWYPFFRQIRIWRSIAQMELSIELEPATTSLSPPSRSGS